MSIWVIEVSRDGGKTWILEQPYRVYKNKEKADYQVNHRGPSRYGYRVREYRPVEE